MIKVLVKKDVIEITGHSDYDTIGKDIVCSAVSSIVTTTINGIISIDENAISYSIYFIDIGLFSLYVSCEFQQIVSFRKLDHFI